MKRTLLGELMDGPSVSPAELSQALAGLRRINRISATARQIARAIRIHRPQPVGTSIRLLDVACGGADVSTEVARRLADRGESVELTLFDRNTGALQLAAANARTILQRDVQTVAGDATCDLNFGTFDIVICTLFLHHLVEDDAVRVLRGMAACTKGLLVVSDLRRSADAWLAAWIGCRLMSRSPIVHFDGPASVRAGWTDDEFVNLATRAGLPNAMVRRTYPYRLQLVWRLE